MFAALAAVLVAASLGALTAASQKQALFTAGTRTVPSIRSPTRTDASSPICPGIFAIDDNGKRQVLTFFQRHSADHPRHVARPNSIWNLSSEAAFVRAMGPPIRRIGSLTTFRSTDRLFVGPRRADHDSPKIKKGHLERREAASTSSCSSRGARRAGVHRRHGLPMNFSNNNKSLKDVMKRAEEEDVMVYAIGCRNGCRAAGRSPRPRRIGQAHSADSAGGWIKRPAQ